MGCQPVGEGPGALGGGGSGSGGAATNAGGMGASAESQVYEDVGCYFKKELLILRIRKSW